MCPHAQVDNRQQFLGVDRLLWRDRRIARRRPVVHVGYVDALANANANERARNIADERAALFRCDADQPVIVRATGPGFSSSEEATRGDSP